MPDAGASPVRRRMPVSGCQCLAGWLPSDHRLHRFRAPAVSPYSSHVSITTRQCDWPKKQVRKG